MNVIQEHLVVRVVVQSLMDFAVTYITQMPLCF